MILDQIPQISCAFASEGSTIPPATTPVAVVAANFETKLLRLSILFSDF
jgi:hypothetical protein